MPHMAGATVGLTVRVAVSHEPDTGLAWEALQSALFDMQPDALILFCSSGHALNLIAEQLANTRLPVLACTSAESAPTIQAMAMRGANLSLQRFAFAPLSSGLAEAASDAKMQALLDAVQNRRAEAHQVGLLLVDGLSRTEEWLAHTLYTKLPQVPFLGGSAGDELRFERTAVYWQGAFHSDMAVFGLFELDTPISLFQSELVGGRGEPMVITLADVQRRAVLQLNGLPAAEVYAAALGIREDALTPSIWRQHPLMVTVGNDQVARAISHIASDGALVCLSAVESGLIATIGEAARHPTDINDLVQRARMRVDNVAGLLLIDCALNVRREDASSPTHATPTITLRSFGEQFNGQHLNASVAGLAFGASP